jgi:hypothetical protein
VLSLAKFAARTGRIGRPLPDPYSIFSLRNVRFRHGATSMIAGKPGSFKSVFALNLLTRWAREGKTALYFSADSDEFTVAKRVASILTGRNQMDEVEPDFLAGRIEPYVAVLKEMSNVRLEYRVMSIDDIADRLAAWEAVYGDYPDLVFVDNLINFAAHPQDWDGMGSMLIEFDGMSREMKSHFCVLHHASESWGIASDPVPRAAIQGKLTQIPRLVLTCAANESALAVCCVKNTNGPQDPDARSPMIFQVKESLAIEDNYRRDMQ